MDFVLQTPSLQHLATVKVIASLWNQRDIWTEIIEVIKCIGAESVDYDRAEFGREETEEWKAIEDQVKAKASVLALPETCKLHLINMIKPLGIQVLNWCMCYYYEENNTHLMCLVRNRPTGSTLRWTFLGTVDYKKTAQIILKDENFDILERYKLACLECLEEDIRELIERIPDAKTKEFINNYGDIKLNLRQRLIASWTCTVGEYMDQLPAKFLPGAGLNYNAFDCAVSYGNRGAADYVFEKVSLNYTVQLLLGQFGWRGFLNLNTIVFHLWSRLGDEQQERLCQMDFGHLLKFFLCWPFQSLFVDMVRRGKRFMRKADYFEVTLFIGARNGVLGYKDYDYSRLLREFWQLIPADSKRRILDDQTCVVQFLETRCEVLITSMLNEASARQIELLSRNSSDGEMRLLLMDESVVSDETLLECKRKAALISSKNPDDEEKRFKRDSLSRFVDSYVERRTEERRKVCS